MDLVWKIHLLLDVNNGTQVDANKAGLAISDTEIRRELEDNLPKDLWCVILQRAALVVRPTTLVEIATLVKSILDIRAYNKQGPGMGPAWPPSRRSKP